MKFIFSYDHVASRLDEFLKEATLTSRARRKIESMSGNIRSLMLLFKNAVSKLLKLESNDNVQHEELVEQFAGALDELEKLMDDYLVNKAEMAAAAAAASAGRYPGAKQAKLFKGFLTSRRLVNEIARKRETFWELIVQNFDWNTPDEDPTDDLSFRHKISNDSSIVLKPRFSANEDPISSSWVTKLQLLLVKPDLQTRAIISIVGLNSEGKKTALVKHVYDDQTVSRRFIIRCWVSVPSKENTLDLLKMIFQKLMGLSSDATIEKNEQELKSEISSYLTSKGRYLIVIDGADLDREAWSSIEDAFPKGGKGSRVVVVADQFEDPDVPISRFSGTHNFIRFNEWAETLIKHLVDPEKKRVIISVVGPSGIGKTALAQHVYDDKQHIAERFPIRCWVAAPHQENRLDLLKRILKGLAGLSDVIMVGMKEQQLKTKITNSLKGKKYLIVIDGAALDKRTWRSIKNALPEEDNGSRVVIVANEFEDQGSISLPIEYLTEQQNWDLFCREAFPNGECPQDLQKFKHQIFKLCGGLPLATVLLAGVLRGKEPTHKEWGKVLSRKQEQEEEGENGNSNKEMEGEKQEQEEEHGNYDREAAGGKQEIEEEFSNYNREIEIEMPEIKEENSDYNIEREGEMQEMEDSDSTDIDEAEDEDEEDEEDDDENEDEEEEEEDDDDDDDDDEEEDSDSSDSDTEDKEFESSGALNILFSEIPHDLSLCFCYLGAYPLNSSIDAQDLMQLWIAEGLIQEVDAVYELTLEDLATRYLQELIAMSLVEPLERDDFGRIMQIRVQKSLHEFLGDVFITIGKSIEGDRNSRAAAGNADDGNPVAAVDNADDGDSDSAAAVGNADDGDPDSRAVAAAGNADDANDNEGDPESHPKHVSLHKEHIGSYLSNEVKRDGLKYLKSLLCMSPPEGVRLSGELDLRNNKILRVIDLQGVRLKNLPDHIGDLIHLRYLCLRNTCLTKLPKSIGRLEKLQMLDLRGTRVEFIVDSFWNIKSLRHVYVPVHFFKSEPSPDDSLDFLQTLDGVSSGPWVNKLEMMSNLRQLTIVNVAATEEETLGKAIKKLKHLRSLKLEGNSLPAKLFKNTEAQDQEACLEHLEEMELSGPLGSRHWVSKSSSNHQLLSKLTVLHLINAGLGQHDIHMLGKLPKLRSLAMWQSYSKRKMEFAPKSFPSLIELVLLSLTELEELIVDKDAMRNLERLTITSCKIKALPNGWEHEKLQNISTRNVPISDKQIQVYLKKDRKSVAQQQILQRRLSRAETRKTLNRVSSIFQG